MTELKTLKDLRVFGRSMGKTGQDNSWVFTEELKAEAVKEFVNVDDLAKVLFKSEGFLKRRLTPFEADILKVYIAWKNNLTEEDLKEAEKWNQKKWKDK